MDPSVLYIIIITALIVAIVLLVVWQIRHHSVMRHLTYQVYDYTVKKAENRAENIVNSAKNEARSILSSAEEQASKFLEERKRAVEDAQKNFESKLGELMTDSESRYEEAAGIAQKRYSELTEGFRVDLSKKISATHESVESEMKKVYNRLNTVTESLGKEYSEQLEARMREVFKKAEATADDYARARQSFVDDRVVELVERASKLSIGRTLSLEEHAEIIKESLEQAKKEGVFGASD